MPMGDLPILSSIGESNLGPPGDPEHVSLASHPEGWASLNQTVSCATHEHLLKGRQVDLWTIALFLLVSCNEGVIPQKTWKLPRTVVPIRMDSYHPLHVSPTPLDIAAGGVIYLSASQVPWTQIYNMPGDLHEQNSLPSTWEPAIRLQSLFE